MDREPLPLRKIIINGIINGLAFALLMAGYDYFTDEPFSFSKFIFHFVTFGFFMAISFRYKYGKKVQSKN
ncbi:hypothetical protein [Winogradskyella pulchriflava]|uniref:Uncharacterized protein n=1 Tax=Winogradskyella pulchriflava TaxID=1110688 RepID=A0ABV6Q7X4_9FLAO